MLRSLISKMLFTLLLGTFLPLVSHAQMVKVIAVVNGEAITSVDFQNRLDFLLVSTGISLTDDNKEQLETDVLQMLIDDKLKLMEARKIAPGLIPAGQTQARQLVNDQYQTDSLSAGAALRELGLDRKTVEDKTASDLIWATMLKERYKSQFDNAGKLAQQALERIKRDLSQPQVRLSEIVLAPSQDRTVAQNLDIARQMIDAINNGADFAAIARQYSAAGTAANGGRLGWIVTKTLPAAFADALDKAPSGALLEPINQDGVVYILRKEGVRAKGLIDPSQARVSIARALMPLPENASSADQLLAAGQLQKQAEGLSSCTELDMLNTQLGSGQPSFLVDVELGSITPNLRAIIEKLEINTPSEPLNFAEGMIVFMVCERTMPELNLPAIEDLERQELNKIFGILSNRYLLRLRRAATIDRRG